MRSLSSKISRDDVDDLAVTTHAELHAAVGMGKDHTLFALTDGSVKFGVRRDRKVVDVIA